MVKRTYVDGNGVRKGAWTSEEDHKLRAYVERYGHWNWRLLPHFAGLDRCGKSCRLRWMNYLKPGVRRGGYTQQETDLIATLHRQHGNKWSIIASKLPGRTDNEIKNYWHAHLKNRLDTSSVKAEISSSPPVTSPAPRLCKRKHEKTRVSSSSSDVFVLESSEELNSAAVVPSVAELGSDLSTRQICSDISSIATQNDDNLSVLLDSGFGNDFWTQPFMVETDSYHGCDFRVGEEVGFFSPFLGTWLNDANDMF